MPTLSSIITWPLRRPVAIIAISLMCAALAALAASRIHADASLAAMFSRNNPSAEALIHVMNDFGAVDELLVLVSIPENRAASPGDVNSLEEFGAKLVSEIALASETRTLTEGAFCRPDEDSRKYFEHVVAPAAMYYLDDASFTAARKRLTVPQMREQIRQDEAMMTAPGAAGSLAKALMRDPLRMREFLGGFTRKFEAMRPFAGREGTDAFVSPDGRNLLVRVRGRKSPSDLEFCKELLHGVAAVAKRVNTGQFELRYAGSYAIAAASATAIKSDMIASVTGSVICLQLLFLLVYRSPIKLFALAFGPIALGILLGFGGYTFFTTTLTPMSAVLGGILAGMAIDYSIQYLSMYVAHRDAGETARQSAEASAVNITPAAFAAWATSIVGFLAIGASSVKSLRDFALLGTLGLTGAFVAKMALLPLLLMMTDRRGISTKFRSTFRVGLEPLLHWIGRHARWAVGTSIGLFLVAAALLVFLPGNILPLESDLTVMHPRPNPALEAQNLIARRFGMRDWVIVYLHADSAPDLISLAHRVEQRLTSKPAIDAGVVGSFGLASVLPDPAIAAVRAASIEPGEADRVVADFRAAINDSPFNPDAQEIRDYEKVLRAILTQLPPTIEDLIQYRRLAEMLLPRSALTPSPSYSGERVGVRGGATLMESTSGPTTTSWVLDSSPSAARPLTPTLSPEYGGEGAKRGKPVGSALANASTHAPQQRVRQGGPYEAITLVFINGSTDERSSRDRAVEGIRLAVAGETGATVTGLSVLSYDTERNVRKDLPRLSLLALAIVLVYLLVHFRNFADAVLTMLPTVFSLVVLLAAMRLAGQKINMINLVAAPLLIGIDVDYGIFLVALARKKNRDRETNNGLTRRIAPVCHAVVVCAAATIVGYGSLMWTSVPAVRSLGFAVAVGIAACLFCCLFLLVPIFLTLRQKKPKSLIRNGSE